MTSCPTVLGSISWDAAPRHTTFALQSKSFHCSLHSCNWMRCLQCAWSTSCWETPRVPGYSVDFSSCSLSPSSVCRSLLMSVCPSASSLLNNPVASRSCHDISLTVSFGTAFCTQHLSPVLLEFWFWHAPCNVCRGIGGCISLRWLNFQGNTPDFSEIVHSVLSHDLFWIHQKVPIKISHLHLKKRGKIN